jgi:hypothetical protein
MTRKNPISEPPATVRAQRPHLAPDANRSFHRIDELDAQNSWQHHTCSELVEGSTPACSRSGEKLRDHQLRQLPL